MSKRIYISAILTLLAVAVSSCRYNDVGAGNDSSTKPRDNSIYFELGTANTLSSQTKSVSTVQSGAKAFLCTEGKDSLYLLTSIYDNNDPVNLVELPLVKGAPVTEETMREFYVMAHLSPDMNYFPFTYVNASSKVEGLYTLDYYWPDEELDFYASNVYLSRASTPLDAVEDENCIYFGYDGEGNSMGQFSYSLPEPDPTLKRDAESQIDFAFAISPDKTQNSSGGVVPLNFAHSLTSVSFKIGSEFMNSQGRQVREIVISGVPSSGLCTFYPDHQTGAMVYDWDTSEAEYKTYIQTIPSAGKETNIDNLEIINSGEMTFMLIPHAIDEDATISITFALHNNLDEAQQHDKVVEKKIKDLFPLTSEERWLPGKKYIYTFYSNEAVEVEIADSFATNDKQVKGSIFVMNTGTTRVYVRAAIVGWWEDSSGDIVAPWNGEGTFSGAGWSGSTFTGTGSNWVKGQDGFYYYNQYLDPNQQTTNLFDSYSIVGVTPPEQDAKLIFNVMTQTIVHYHSDQWPNLVL